MDNFFFKKKFFSKIHKNEKEKETFARARVDLLNFLSLLFQRKKNIASNAKRNKIDKLTPIPIPMLTLFSASKLDTKLFFCYKKLESLD